MIYTIQGVTVGIDAVSAGSEFVVNVGDLQASIIIRDSDAVRSAVAADDRSYQNVSGYAF